MHSWVLYYFQSICSYCKYKHTNKWTTSDLILHAFLWFLICQILQNRRHTHQKHNVEILLDTVFFNMVLQGHSNNQSWNTQLLRKSQKNWAYLAESNSWKHWESTTAFQNPKVGYLEDSTEVLSEKTKETMVINQNNGSSDLK